MEPQPNDNSNANQVGQSPQPLRPPVPVTPGVSPAPSELSASPVPAQEAHGEQVVQGAQSGQLGQETQSAQPEQEAQAKTPSSDKKRTIGIICAALGVGLVATLIAIFVPWKDLLGGGLGGLGGNVTGGGSNEVNNVDDVPDLSTFAGEGFELSYIEPWEETYLDDLGEVLVYGEDNYLLPVGSSTLSDISSFATEGERDEVYEMFYDYWNNDTYEIYSGQGFKVLKDDIYYARMDYKINGFERGSFFLIASEPDDAVLSFMTNTGGSVDEMAQMALSVLKTIKITLESDDDIIGDYLNAMSNWNLYSDIRSGSLGSKKVIDGGWRILSEAGQAYWVFRNGEFWWYKSYDDLTDNYWYGKVRRATLSEVGLNDSSVERVMEASSGNVTADDVYALVFTPETVIVNGEDKSSTNIAGEDWHIVWILIDHGREGIEAQTMNVKNYETDYYVKTSD